MSSPRLSFIDSETPAKQTIVFAGSLGSTHAMWDEQVNALSPSARVIAYDHRGHGDSDVPIGPYSIDDLGMDALRLMDSLGIESASFVGLSLGGMVGMWLGINAPDRLERLVLMCTSAHMPDAGPWLERSRAVRADGTASIANAVVSRWFTEDFAATQRDIVASMVQMVSDTSDEGYASCCEAIAAMDMRADLANIDTPTLVIAAAQDPSTPAETSVAPIAAAIPNSQYVVVDDAAHLVNVQQPALTSGLLSGFLLT